MHVTCNVMWTREEFFRHEASEKLAQGNYDHGPSEQFSVDEHTSWHDYGDAVKIFMQLHPRKCLLNNLIFE